MWEHKGNGAPGPPAQSSPTPDHGTAVVGEIAACDNGYGMTGITSDIVMKLLDRDSEVVGCSKCGRRR